jgi:hypothetical protein
MLFPLALFRRTGSQQAEKQPHQNQIMDPAHCVKGTFFQAYLFCK